MCNPNKAVFTVDAKTTEVLACLKRSWSSYWDAAWSGRAGVLLVQLDAPANEWVQWLEGQTARCEELSQGKKRGQQP